VKLREIVQLTGSDLWRAVQGIRKPEHLDWLETQFGGNDAVRDFIRARRDELLPIAAQFTVSLDILVARATGCTPWEANQALNTLQQMASTRREAEGGR